MQNSNSKSLQSFADLNRRSKSLSKITDQSSILHTCNDLGSGPFRIKLSESNIGYTVQSKKTLAFKPSRPTTANTNHFSPQKGSLAISRSESPFCVGSPSANGKSTQAKWEKVADSKVYEAIKSQNKLFFSKNLNEIPYFIPLQDVLARQVAGQDTSIQISTMRDQINSTSRQTRLSTEMSPRKKLAIQPRKIYNVKAMRLKESLMSTINAPIKVLERRGSREQSLSKRSIKKDDKLAVKEENPAAQLAAMKKLEEERKFIDSIGKASFDRFYMNIDLYNKYYAAYLHEPEVHYTGLEDLKVTLRPRGEDQLRAQSQDNEKEKKKAGLKGKDGQAVKHFGPFKLNTQVIESRKSQVARASMLKFSTERVKRENRKGVEWADLGKDEEESGGEGNEWMLFGKEMAGVQHNLKNLQKINGMMANSNQLSEEEQAFLKAVKEGNEGLVEKMLRMNSELVKIKDIGNKTPMHWAMKRHYVGIVGELYSHGADLEEVDMTGRKPLDLVKGPHKKEILGILEQKHWRLRRKTATFA